MTRSATDGAYAYLGWYLLAFPPVVGVARLVAPALATGRTPFLLAGLAALPLAALHLAAGWSVGTLGATFFWSVALTVVVGLPVVFLADWFGVDLGSLPLLTVVPTVYAAAYVLAARPGAGRREGPAA